MRSTHAAGGDAVREAHQFEELLSEVFARFAAAKPDEIDDVITWSLGEVVAFLGGQRAGIFLFSPDKEHLEFGYHWNAEDARLALSPGEAVPAYKLDWVIETVRRGKICVVRDRDELPADAVVYLNLLEEMNLQATVNVPLFRAKSLVGIFGFGSERKALEWDDGLLSRLQLVGRVISSALERKRIRSELQRAEERFRVASELALDFVWEADVVTGEIGLFGERLHEFSKFSDGEMPVSLDEKSWGWWKEHLHPDDYGRVEGEFKALIEKGEPMKSEFRIRADDGSYRHWIEHADCLRDGQGTPLKLIGAIHDVTEQREAEEMLRRAHETMEVVAKSVTDLVFQYDVEADTADNVERFDEILGYDPGEWASSIGWWEENLHPDDRERAMKIVRHSLETGEPNHYEARVRTKQGDYRTWKIRSAPIMDDEGNAVKLIGAVDDITEERRAEEELKQSEELYRAVLDSFPEEVVVLDAGGVILSVNETWEQFAIENNMLSAGAASPGANYLDACREIGHQDDGLAKKAHDGITAILDGELKKFTMEYPCHCPTERRWFLLHAVPLLGKRGGAVVSHTNITHLKEAQAALHESETRFRSIFEDSAVGMFVISPACTISAGNRALGELLGYTLDELAGKPVSDLLHPEQLKKGIEKCEKLFAGELDQFTEERILQTKKGEAVWVNYSASSVKDEAGKLLYGLALVEDISERRKAEETLREAFAEIKTLKDRLEQENIYLREQVDVRLEHEDIVGQSAAIKEVLRQVEQVAVSEANVLIQGETGTGKELVASAIHNLSRRKEHPMVRVNCGALPTTLIESELFGREKGAYTGAVTRQAGRFELADKSTIFLDEVGELPAELQAKLLRVLESGEFERLGSPKTMKVDVRVIAATNRDLAKEVDEGNFREDLFYRLNVFPVSVPPLRERPEDIPLLVWTFIKELSDATAKRVEAVSKTDIEKLKRYPWPGNVRELRNVIERAIILSDGRKLHLEMPDGKGAAKAASMTLEDVERSHITQVLEMSGWRVRGEGGAAQILGLNEATLRSRMKKLGIERPR